MEIKKIHLVYFSATNTTKKITTELASKFNIETNIYDLTESKIERDLMINSDELLIVGMPVYSGRIPAITIDSLNKIKGSQSPAVIVCVYGNRDEEVSLPDLKSIISRNGHSARAVQCLR